MPLPWVSQQKRELLPSSLTKILRDDREIATFDHWKATEGKKRLPALDLEETKSGFDKKTCQYVEVKPHHDLEEVLSNWGTIEPGMEFQSCHWEDVMTAIETAKEAYAMKAKNKGRAVLRNLATIKTLQTLSQVVPEQDGLSVLRGGLTLVFKLIERRIENQGKILKTLEDIPFIFERACNDLSSFGADELLVTRVRHLYAVLVQQIAVLLRILLRKQKGSGLRKFMRQHPEQEAVVINEALELINRACNAVETRTRYLRDQRNLQIQDTVVETGQAIKGIERKFGEGSEHLKVLGDRFEAMERRMINIEASVHTHCIEEALFLNTNVFYLFAQNILQAQHIPKQITGPSPPYYDQALPPSPGFSQSPQLGVPSLHVEVGIEQIFDIVNIDPVMRGHNTSMPMSHLPNIGHVADDMEHVLRQSGDLQESALRRTNWLLATDRFRSWLRSGTEQDRGQSSDLILVNGQCDEDFNNSVSALSVFCTALISMMIRKRDHTGREVVLHYFCGLHTHPKDSISGPRGMLRSIIAQLCMHLARWGIDTQLVDQNCVRDAGEMSGYDPNALCALLGQLLGSVPSGVTVFIVLDNVSHFESTAFGWLDDMLVMVSQLRGIGYWLGPSGAQLRMMMTCAMRSTAVDSYLHPDDIISLEAENECEWLMDVDDVQDF